MKKSHVFSIGLSLSLATLYFMLGQNSYAKFGTNVKVDVPGATKVACYSEAEDSDDGEIVIHNAADLADALADGSDLASSYTYDNLGRLILKPCTGIAISGNGGTIGF